MSDARPMPPTEPKRTKRIADVRDNISSQQLTSANRVQDHFIFTAEGTAWQKTQNITATDGAQQHASVPYASNHDLLPDRRAMCSSPEPLKKEEDQK